MLDTTIPNHLLPRAYNIIHTYRGGQKRLLPQKKYLPTLEFESTRNKVWKSWFPDIIFIPLRLARLCIFLGFSLIRYNVFRKNPLSIQSISSRATYNKMYKFWFSNTPLPWDKIHKFHFQIHPLPSHACDVQQNVQIFIFLSPLPSRQCYVQQTCNFRHLL